MRKYDYLAVILSGIFVGTSFIPFYPWAIFFAWVPLWRYWVENPDPKKVFWSGWTTQFIFTLIGFHWVYNVAKEFGHLPLPVAILALLAFSTFANLQVPISGWLWSYLHKRYLFSRRQSFIILSLLLIVFEYFFPMIFPWNMGYTWYFADWPSYNWAEVFGFQGLSAITIFINLLVVQFLEKRNQRKPTLAVTLAIAGLLLVLNFTGLELNKKWNSFDAKVSFLQVQANIGNFEKYAAERKGMFKDYILDRYIELSRKGLQSNPNTDIVLWPETAIPDRLDKLYQFAPYQQLLKSRIKELGKPVITGAYSQEPTSDKTYNAIFFFGSDGEQTVGPYRKNILLAFGEYFPGAEWFPKLKDLVPEISDFGRGPGSMVIPFQGLFIGPQICYEGLFPYYTRELLVKGAQILVNTTNDSWYDKVFEPQQHMYMTLGRAIEFRRPLVRVTNTGITTAVLSNGQILGKTPMNQEISQFVEIPYLKDPKHTFFERNGHLYPYFFLLITLIFIVRCILNRETN